MTIAVVGAGAIGGFIAAALRRSGCSVYGIVRGKPLVAIREHGLRVAVSELGPFKVKLPAYASLDEAPDAQALLLTFKAHQWRDVLAQIARAVARGAFIVQPAI